jgi:hypothetical protein
MKIQFILIDTFNNVTISAHQFLDKAVEARNKHQQAIKNRNGAGAYLTYAILEKAEGEVACIKGVNNYGFRFADDEEINCLQQAYDDRRYEGNAWKKTSLHFRK